MKRSYFQDVKTLSDSELVKLSEELIETYRSMDEDGFDWWSDDEAEKRYYALNAERQRRDDERHPHAAKRREKYLEWIGKLMPEYFKSYRYLDDQVAVMCAGLKVGDTITIRKPDRYVVK